MGLGGISFASSLWVRSSQRGKSARTISADVYDLRSNCAAGICPLWQPAQYFVTNGWTAASNSCCSAGAVAATAGPAATASRAETVRKYIEQPLFHLTGSLSTLQDVRLVIERLAPKV